MSSRNNRLGKTKAQGTKSSKYDPKMISDFVMQLGLELHIQLASLSKQEVPPIIESMLMDILGRRGEVFLLPFLLAPEKPTPGFSEESFNKEHAEVMIPFYHQFLEYHTKLLGLYFTGVNNCGHVGKGGVILESENPQLLAELYDELRDGIAKYRARMWALGETSDE